MTDFTHVFATTSAITLGEPVTAYGLLGGLLSTWNTTEAPVQNTARDSYTLKNLWCKVLTNTINADTTVRTRKNAGNGSQSVTITSSSTGTFEDTSNTDSVVTGDDINYQVVTTSVAGTPTININPISVISSHSANVAIQIAAQAVTRTVGAVYYMPIGGSFFASTTETSSQRTARTAVTLSQLRAYISSSASGAATIRSRVNAGNGAQSVSISSGSTGEFVDGSNSDSISVGDEINSLVDHSAGNFELAVIEYEIDGALHQVACPSGTAAINYNGQTLYSPLHSRLNTNANTTEANVQTKARVATDFKNFFVYSTANAANNTSTVALRGSGSNKISVSIAASTSGVFEETSTTYTPATTDLLNYLITAGGSGNLTLSLVSVEQIPTAGAATAVKDLIGMGIIPFAR